MPSLLAGTLERQWQDFIEAAQRNAVEMPDDARWQTTLAKVWACSPFVACQCIRRPQLLAGLVASGDLFSARRRGAYRRELTRLLETVEDRQALWRVLRRFRNREMVRIAWRNIAGWDAIEDVLCDLSLLAEACLQAALAWLFERACKRYGTPVGQDGAPQQPVVLGMGKLGGWELNFSSDIDLIFAYERDGTLNGHHSYQEFYLRLCRDLVQALSRQTEDGFVFRVDTRLRPFGDAGALVWSFEAMDLYYQSQARDWERYAMIKARPVAGDLEAGRRLVVQLRPFVYRRYLDYRALGALRELKRKIAAEVQRRDRLDDIKLGPGGIREIEFIAQVFQLIHGGRRPELQEPRLLPVLARLGRIGMLPPGDADDLIAAYRFLRRLENRLQEVDDQQTQCLPRDPVARARLALGVGCGDWEELAGRLEQVRATVQRCFAQVFAEPESPTGGLGAEIWREAAEEERLLGWLAGLGYRKPTVVLQRLRALRGSRALRLPRAEAAEAELARLMPRLLEEVARTAQPDPTLQRMLDLIEAIASRSVYLTLLAENPTVRQHLVHLVGASPWIARLLARHPALLDELLDPRTLYAPLTRRQLEAELNRRLETLEGDEEAVFNALHHFKQAQVLRVAAADLAGAIPTRVVSDYLTEIAEVVLERVLALAWRDVSARYGPPPGAERNGPRDFAIIGYGKLGGIELGYGSDLDLVFLYRGDPAAMTAGPRQVSVGEFYIRLGQRIVHILTVPLLAGVLYQIDMRLRPSGNAGLLVSSLEAFARYQRGEAWTWEHQALVRARPVAGDRGLGEAFAAVRQEILCRRRDPEILRREVLDMRRKMRRHLDRSDAERFDLKQGSGGMVDIEFIVQFGCLAFAHRAPEAFRWTDNLRLLEALVRVGWLDGRDVAFLQETYLDYRTQVHRLALQERPALVPVTEFADRCARVRELWQRLIEHGRGDL